MKSSPHYGKPKARTLDDMTKKEFMIDWALRRASAKPETIGCDTVMRDAADGWDVLQRKLKESN